MNAEPAGTARPGRGEIALLALLLAGVAAFFALHRHARGMFTWDEAEYATLGRSLLRGEGFTVSGVPAAFRDPVLPLSGAAAMLLTGRQTDGALVAVVVAFALALLALLWALTRRRLSPAGALAAAAMLAAMPAFGTMVPGFMAEVPFLAFFVPAVFLFDDGLRRDSGAFALALPLSALAVLTRYTGVLFLPMAAGLAAAALARDPRGAWRRLRSRSLAAGLAAGGAILAPWLAREWRLFGDPLHGFRVAARELPSYLPGMRFPWYTYFALLPRAVSPVVLGFALVGAALALRRRDALLLRCLAIAAFFLAWFSFYRFKEERMLVPILPFVAILAAAPIAQVARRSRALAAVLVLAAAAPGFLATRRRLMHTVTLGYPSFREAMLDLRVRSAPSDVVMGASVPQISWYADRRTVPFPEERAFGQAASRAAWVVVVNFERSQPSYAFPFPERISRRALEAGSARVFWDGRFLTALMRPYLLGAGP